MRPRARRCPDPSSLTRLPVSRPPGSEQRLEALEHVVSTLKSRKAPQSDIEQVMAKIDALRAASRSTSPASLGEDEEEEGEDVDDPAAAVVSEEGVQLLKQEGAARPKGAVPENGTDPDGTQLSGADHTQGEGQDQGDDQGEEDEDEGKDSGSDQV